MVTYYQKNNEDMGIFIPKTIWYNGNPYCIRIKNKYEINCWIYSCTETDVIVVVIAKKFKL